MRQMRTLRPTAMSMKLGRLGARFAGINCLTRRRKMGKKVLSFRRTWKRPVSKTQANQLTGDMKYLSTSAAPDLAHPAHQKLRFSRPKQNFITFQAAIGERLIILAGSIRFTKSFDHSFPHSTGTQYLVARPQNL
jgi:hypothetical protein